MVDHAAGDFHLGVAKNTAGITAETVVNVLIVNIVIHTATTGIDIAEESVVTTGHAAPAVGDGVIGGNAGVVVNTVDGSVDAARDGTRGIAVGRLTADNAGSHNDMGILRDVAVGTAAEDGTTDIGHTMDVLNGSVADEDEGVVGIGHVVVLTVTACTCDTAAGAEDGALVVARVTDAATEDAHMRKASANNRVTYGIIAGLSSGGGIHVVVEDIAALDRVTHNVVSATGNIVDGIADGGQGTAAEDIVVDDAAGDLDIGIAKDTASGEAVGVVHEVGLRDTTAATIDVTGVDISTRTLIGLIHLGVTEVGTYLAVLNLDGSVPPNVAVLGAAEDRTVDAGRATNGDIGVAHIVIIGIVVGVISDLRLARVAVASTIDVAIIGILDSQACMVGTNGATSDGNMGVTVGHGVALSEIVRIDRAKGTYRGHLSTAIDVLLHCTVGDVDIGIHIDIGRDGVAGVAFAGTVEVAVDDTVGVLHVDRSATVNFRQLTATVDIASALHEVTP